MWRQFDRWISIECMTHKITDMLPQFKMNSISALLFLILPLSSHASIKEISKRIITMPVQSQSQCQALGTCALKGAQLIERKIKVLLPDEPPEKVTVMTDMRMILNFDSTESIEKFGVVQFIRGCMYESTLNMDGSTSYSFSAAHKNFGQYKLIKYSSDIVDAVGTDPVSSAWDGRGRFDLYRWNKDPKSTDPENDNWYAFGKPAHGTVYLSDLVSYTGLKDQTPISARNSSIEMNTCIFKISDLPKTSDPTGTGIDRSKAIWCANWDHRFRYDFGAGEIVPESVISPSCSLELR